MRIALFILGAICALSASFFIALAILDNYGASISLATSSLATSLGQALSPGSKILKSDQLDLKSVSHSTGAIVDGIAIASAPKDPPGFLLSARQLKLGTGSYRVEVIFSCNQNEAANFIELYANNPTYRITRFDMVRRAPACDGSMKDVALEFKLLTAPESILVNIQYGGSGMLEVKKIMVHTLSEAKH